MVVVHGTLVDGAGARTANAQIDYSALSTTPRARVQNLGAVRTDNDGTFTLTVATKLGSRKLEFAYRPQLGGTIATAADAQLDVKAPVSLRIRPHFVHNGHRITFGGRLSAGPIPRKGKLVNLQVVVDGHWHTFATVRTNKSGRFKYRYRFTRTYGHVTYRFRALSRYEAAYPFAAGSSNTVAVHVTSCPVGCE
jgi:5-hydroxyisourate hydrolase-like protein (transthyretin family)